MHQHGITTPTAAPPGRVRTLKPRLIAGCVLWTVLCLAWGWPGVSRAQAQPNVLSIIVDDLDVQTWQQALRLGVLPHIQSKLIDVGTRFSNSFVTQPLCCPSRASYLTGLYAHNHGVVRNQGPHGGFGAFDDRSTLPVWLQQAGYRVGLVGKYLNGYNQRQYVPPGYDTWNAALDGSGAYCMYNYRLANAGGPSIDRGASAADYKTDVLAQLAQAFVASNDPRPFFLTVTPTAPHYEDCQAPYTVRGAPRHRGTVDGPLPAAALASFNEADMQDKPGWMQSKGLVDAEVQRRFFNQMIESMRAVDDLVGTLVAELSRSGKLASTLIVLTSDNGLQFGTHRRLGKQDLYEESIRVPLVIRTPGQNVPATRDAWVLNIDLAPTIVDFASAVAGLEPDGRSMRPLLEPSDTAVPWRRTVLAEKPFVANEVKVQHPYYSLRTRSPALTGDAMALSTLVYAHTLDQTTGQTSAVEFYDLLADPLQIRSRHRSTDPDEQERMARLKARLGLLARCRGDACRVWDQ